MTTRPELGQRLADHYAREAPPRAPDRVLAEALSTIETTRQQRALGSLPGRIRVMNNVAKVAVAALVLIALGAIGLAVLGPSTGVGHGGLAEPSSQPSRVPSGGPASPALPPLSSVFTSPVNGYSISYPADWKVTTATEWWASGSTTFNPDDPSVDSFSGPNVAIYVVSQKIAGGTAPTAWLDKYLSDSELNDSTRPDCAVVKTQPVVVDGAAGVVNYSCSAVLIDATVTAGGRGYVFSLQGDSPDKAWLLEVLKTVKLHPESAVEVAPSVAPSASPSANP
jgi:hypothetical protein